jgi:tRNA A-37 threonylcarbamoyl transferase component Bud32
MSKGVKTPRPVWLAEGYDTNAAYSMIATELLPDSESALARWQRCENEKQRRELLIAMGQFTGRLHDLGFYHDDYKAAHLLIFPDRPSLPGEFHLIDLLGGSFPAVMTPLGRAKNLYQLIRSLKPKRRDYGFTPEHRDILLLAYSGSALDAVSWGKWVNRVGRLKGRMV